MTFRLRRVAAALAVPAALTAGLSGAAPDAAWSRFVDITSASGVTFIHRASATPEKYLLETMGGGVGVFDYDGDGRLDIFFANGARLQSPMTQATIPAKSGPEFSNRLLHQRSDGRFEDVTARAGLEGAGYGMGVAVGDYDNDGHPDLYVTAYPRNALYRNNGNGTFTDVTGAAGVAGSGWSTSATFVDVDRDGRLDLLVLRYLDWSFADNPWCGDKSANIRAYCHPDQFKGIAPLLFHNEGNGGFKDITSGAGLGTPSGKSLGVAIGDYDRDGLVDLFIANDSVREFLYHNRGNGTFEDRALLAGAAVNDDGQVYAGMGVDFADYDNDGWPDIVVTTLSNQMYALYRNGGDGSFSYATHDSGLGRMTLLRAGWGVRLVDLDNDGWKDLFVAQGHVLDTIALTSPHITYAQVPLVAQNMNGRSFVDRTSASGDALSHPWAARGLAVGDLDNDGDEDLVVTTINGPAYMLRNDSPAGRHWITVTLEGRRSNRDGIGASIHLTSGSGHEQWATVTTSSSYLSASDKRVHFGLGGDTSVRAIEVWWPSGTKQRIDGPAVDRQLTIAEPTQP